jgi:hypothetical protein
MTLKVDDRGPGGSGAIFSFDVTAVSSGNRRIEIPPRQDNGKPVTLRITNIKSISGPKIASGGLSGVMVKFLKDPGDAGIVYAENDARKVKLGTWNDSKFQQLVSTAGKAAVSIEPTSGKGSLQGFTATFKATSKP